VTTDPDRPPATRGGLAELVRSLLSQWAVEWRLRRRATRYRTDRTEAVRAAYDGLTAAEFEAVNATQRWTNSWLIPRAVAGLLPARAVIVVDLGCGTGDSTAVLARCAAPGSRLRGYDLSRMRLLTAQGRVYRHRDGSAALATFHCQSIDEPLRDSHGAALPDASVDFAHSSGVVGHHLDTGALGRLAVELRRVVRPGGAVVLDAGPRLCSRTRVSVLGGCGFDVVAEHRIVPFNPRAQLAFRRHGGPSANGAGCPGRSPGDAVTAPGPAPGQGPEAGRAGRSAP
jgi:SAM-dependent methyltransferase